MTWGLSVFNLFFRTRRHQPAFACSSRRLVFWLGLTAFAVSPLVGAGDPAVQPLLDADRTVTGELLHHPDGTPMRIDAMIVSFQPGDSTGWHCHGRPMFAYLLSGVLEVEYQGQGRKTLKAGDALMETMAVPHRGTNHGDVPVRILAVYITGQGPARLAVPAVEVDATGKVPRYACPPR